MTFAEQMAIIRASLRGEKTVEEAGTEIAKLAAATPPAPAPPPPPRPTPGEVIRQAVRRDPTLTMPGQMPVVADRYVAPPPGPPLRPMVTRETDPIYGTGPIRVTPPTPPPVPPRPTPPAVTRPVRMIEDRSYEEDPAYGSEIMDALIDVDRGINAMTGGDPRETISARVGRNQDPISRGLSHVLNTIDPGHTTRAVARSPVSGCVLNACVPLTARLAADLGACYR